MKNEPAFPVHRYNHPGMTLRDYFAGQALAGLAVSSNEESDPMLWRWNDIAITAYMAADAMLAEREKPNEP